MSRGTRLLASGLVLVGLASGCKGPLDGTSERALREQLIAQNQRYVKAATPGPVLEISRAPSEVERELTPERRAELDKIGGPTSYEGEPLVLGPDLQGQSKTPSVRMNLHRAVEMAVRNNLDVQLAQMLPAIDQARITQAQAAFDAVFFSTFEFEKLDTPQPPTSAATFAAFGSVQSDRRQLTTGIRKPLTSGGEITASTRFARNFRDPSFFVDDTFYDADVLVNLRQPLLRNLGADVVRAEILLSENARRQTVQDLKARLLQVVADTEQTYWDLVFARQSLLIQTRLLKRTIDERDKVRIRYKEGFDVSPVQLAQANSFVELRQADVIRARQQVRLASDRLKALINDPELPVAGETLLLPLEEPPDLAVKFSLLDAVTTALRRRPEAERALLEIRDTSIRQRVASNQMLPLLDLNATVRFNGVSSDAFATSGTGTAAVTRQTDTGSIGNAYDALTDGDFIDYILSVQFEVPIGNRGPSALYRQRQLERRAAVLNYQRTAQQVVLEVKESMRTLLAAYELIGATRAARRAAADNLRAIEAQEEAGVPLTPEFLLDLKLNTQQRLANAELEEAQSLAQYNTAIARLFQAMGTLLERDGVEFVEREADDPYQGDPLQLRD